MHEYILGSLGGLCIAIASSLHLYLKGRVTGFSGILFNLWSCQIPDNHWRWLLVLGLMTSSAIMRLASYDHETFFDNQEKYHKDFDLGALFISGFLVGFGTKLGNGCTSGHGVCGLPRFSGRSIVGVAIFLLAGMGIATLRKHKPFFDGEVFLTDWGVTIYEESDDANKAIYYSYLAIVLIITIIALLYYYFKEYSKESRKFSDVVVGYIVGVIFGFGLCISGMTKRSRVLDFLAISSDWDATLLFVLGVAVAINILTFYFILKKEENPPFSDKPINLKPTWDIDFNLCFGEFCFGIGWGLSGLCPGPVMVDLVLYFPILCFYIIFILIGQLLAFLYVKYFNWFGKKPDNNKIVPIKKEDESKEEQMPQKNDIKLEVEQDNKSKDIDTDIVKAHSKKNSENLSISKNVSDKKQNESGYSNNIMFNNNNNNNSDDNYMIKQK